ncbi:MAG: hypothetical protein IKQ60_10810 [Candidatus Methanomethylophilaceae archaeon]|nr:hypothetical protein [Candidatus Methanomethylophilaceae archaeon]
MGLGLVEHFPEDVDWGLDLLDHMVPGIESPMTARWNGFVQTPGWHGCGLRM